MHFGAWFEGRYRQNGESVYRAIHRLSLQSGLGWTTILRAVNGSRVQPAKAAILAGFTDGAVDAESLKSAPTRRELREAEALR